MTTVDPAALVHPRRSIRTVASAACIDWDAFAAHVARTAAAGITPAVNMDTGYVQLIDDAIRRQAPTLARDTLGPDGELVAGACVVDAPFAEFDEAGYGRQFDMIATAGAIPVIFSSHGLTAGTDADFVARIERQGAHAERFIGSSAGRPSCPMVACSISVPTRR
jgi:NAD(P)H-dependent flavin oxidoreductase YrpB (nitropropane dioxygenase family)